MAEHLLTKCPHCSTTFRLTQAQLDIAGGAVRCGACYQVFHAAEHIVKTSVVEEHREVTKEPDPVEEAFDVKNEKGMDPYDSSDIEEMDKSDNNAFTEEYRASLDDESNLKDFGYSEDKPKKNPQNDESWAEDLLKELGEDEEEAAADENENEEPQTAIISGDNAFSLDERPQPTKKKERKGTELSDTFKSLGTFSSEDPFAISEIEEEEFGDSGDENTDESWAKAMLDELEEEERPKTPVSNELAILLDEEPEDDSPFASKELSKDKEEIKLRTKEGSQKQKQLDKQSKHAESLRTDETEDFFNLLEDTPEAPNTHNEEPEISLDSLEQEPEEYEFDEITPENLFADTDDIINQQVHLSEIEYAGEEEHRSVAKIALLLMGSIVLIAGLAAQYVYFNFEQASRNPTIRPWAEKTCAILGCDLAAQSDVSQIVGTNLVVRSHPYEKNALVIDVIIKNRAAFQQPYPQVQLSFEDINGEPVAGRRFTPQEYIKDKLIDLNSMPSDVPIHLTLEVVDPGRDAVNYQLHFLPQDGSS